MLETSLHQVEVRHNEGRSSCRGQRAHVHSALEQRSGERRTYRIAERNASFLELRSSLGAALPRRAMAA